MQIRLDAASSAPPQARFSSWFISPRLAGDGQENGGNYLLQIACWHPHFPLCELLESRGLGSLRWTQAAPTLCSSEAFCGFRGCCPPCLRVLVLPVT